MPDAKVAMLLGASLDASNTAPSWALTVAVLAARRGCLVSVAALAPLTRRNLLAMHEQMHYPSPSG